MNGQVCVLDDGRRVKFSLKKRNRDRFYLVNFRGPDEKPKERSTKESNKKRASDAAVVIIKDEYTPKTSVVNPSWHEAIEIMKQHMEARNLRPSSIADYEFAIGSLRKLFPDANGPADINSACGERFKIRRLKAGLSPHTVKGNLNSLNVIYGHWWVGVCRILSENPFEHVDPPKTEKKPPRVIEADEEQQFVNWLFKRWDGWRLPILFLEVKGAIGCRITELASLPSANLKEGRLLLEAETTKGRKQRQLKLPASLFDELQKIAGATFVFEAFSDQLRDVHRHQGRLHHAASVKEFSPGKLRNWLQDELGRYFEAHPNAKRFKLHNFRGTAMSKARMAGVSFDDAAVAFGCHPETMRKHYISLDETTISDRVMEEIQSKRREGNGEKKQPTNPSNPLDGKNGEK